MKTKLLMLLLAGFCFSLSACNQKATEAAVSSPAPTPAPAPPPPPVVSQKDLDIEAAKKCITQGLNDPLSAQFTKINEYNGIVSGNVNAKNQFGGYTGPQPFCWARTGAKPPPGVNLSLCCFN